MITIHATSNEDAWYINFCDQISHLSSAYDQIGVSKFSDVEEIKSYIDDFLIRMSKLKVFA